MSVWLAGALWLVCAVTIGATVVIATIRDGGTWSLVGLFDAADFSLGNTLLAIGQIVPVTVGALVASRRPANPIGWLFCLTGVAFSGSVLASTVYPAGTSSVPSAGRWFAWFTETLSSTALVTMVTYLLLLFPTGRMVSRRWRPVAWFAGALIGGLALTLMFGDEQVWADPLVNNPAQIESLRGLFAATGALALFAFPAVVLASLASLVFRFRGARGIERQQIKWFALCAGLVVTMLLSALVLLAVGLDDNWILGVLFFGGIEIGIPIAIPIVVGISILRHNLFDIDRIINRTLVYLTLSGSLVAVYLATVVGLGSLLRGFSGASSSLMTAASTLLVAALFRPLRGQVQRAVDRRFYRRNYDASQTIEAFSARLRDGVDLTTIGDELQTILADTMQPAQVSLWLRPPPSRP